MPLEGTLVLSLKRSVSHDSRITAWFLNDPEGVLLSQARVWNSCRADQGACFNEGSILSASTPIMLFVELKSFRFYMICKERRAVLLLPIVALLYLQIFNHFFIYNRCFNFLKLKLKWWFGWPEGQAYEPSASFLGVNSCLWMYKYIYIFLKKWPLFKASSCKKDWLAVCNTWVCFWWAARQHICLLRLVFCGMSQTVETVEVLAWWQTFHFHFLARSTFEQRMDVLDQRFWQISNNVARS